MGYRKRAHRRSASVYCSHFNLKKPQKGGALSDVDVDVFLSSSRRTGPDGTASPPAERGHRSDLSGVGVGSARRMLAVRHCPPLLALHRLARRWLRRGNRTQGANRMASFVRVASVKSHSWSSFTFVALATAVSLGVLVLLVCLMFSDFCSIRSSLMRCFNCCSLPG